MSPRHLVRGETSGWLTFGKIAGALAAIVGVAICFQNAAVGMPVMAAGFVLGITLESVSFAIRRNRVWVEFDDAGFTVLDRLTTREFRDDEIHAIAYDLHPNFKNGLPTGFTRNCTLWVAHGADEPEPIVMTNRFRLNERDPLEVLLVRVQERLRADFDAALDAGHALEGADWRLTREELACRRGGVDEAIPLSEIAAVEPWDGKIGVWRKGVDAVHVAFAVKDRNVWLLLQLLQPRIRSAGPSNQPPAEGMGRILFERRAGTGDSPYFVIATIALPIIGGLLWTLARGDARYWGLACIALSPFLAVGVVSSWRWSFRCHEWGVRQIETFRDSTLKYSDVAAFTFAAVRQYDHGVYAGTQVTMKFVPFLDVKAAPIAFSTTVMNQDVELDKLRDLVAAIVAQHMMRDFREGSVVPWTYKMTFRPEGIEYETADLLARRSTQVMPYSEFGSWTIETGIFRLFRQGIAKPIVTQNVGEENFFPGLVLLQSMFPAP